MKAIFSALMLALVTPLHAEEPYNAKVLEGKLQQIILPRVSFIGTTLEEALDFLRQRSVELDQDPPPSTKGVAFVVIPAAGPDAGSSHAAAGGGTINYSGTHVTLEIVLREIAKSANQDVYLTSVGIVVGPRGLPAFPNPKAEKGEILRKLTPEASE